MTIKAIYVFCTVGVSLLFSGLVLAETTQNTMGDSDKSINENSEASLHVKPNRCIALHQGQVCYQKLHFTWTTPSTGDYCLVKQSTSETLICWQGQSTTRYTYRFKSSHSDIFILRDQSDNLDIDHTTVDVAWVYKNTKKVTSGWRLF